MARAAEADKHAHEVQAAIESMDPTTVLCRDIRHNYKPWTARWIPQDRQYESALKCSNCGTVRIRRISERGALLASSYEYADGYLVKGLGRLEENDRNAIRLRSLLGMIEDAK